MTEVRSRKPEAGSRNRGNGRKGKVVGSKALRRPRQESIVYPTPAEAESAAFAEFRDAPNSGNGRSAIRTYRDIEAFQRTMAIMAPLHRLVRKLPVEERYELGSQMRRASKSIALNIAEGYGKKRSTAQFRTFIDHAQGSANEVIVQLEIGVSVGYFTQEEIQLLVAELEIIARQLYRLAENWRNFAPASASGTPRSSRT
jgi:four helix bundle protein